MRSGRRRAAGKSTGRSWDDISNTRWSHVCALHTTITIANACSAEPAAGWVSASDTLNGNKERAHGVVDDFASVRSGDVAHEAWNVGETPVTAFSAPIMTISKR